MSFADIQRRLAAEGFDPGPIDGIPGKQTYTALFDYMAGKDLGAKGEALGRGAAKHFPEFGITTPLRIAHFLAQGSAETGGFHWLREIWGPTDAQKRYEGRKDLGNVIPGDGYRFLGRGIFQITGRDNYERYGKRIGIDLTCDPAKAEDPETALWIACLYWHDLNLNQFADLDQVRAVSNGINRSNPASQRAPNGYEARKTALARAKAVLL